MRITRLHHSGNLSCGGNTQLDANASNHLIRVLRTKINSPVILFNGDGFDYYCTIQDDNPKKALLLIKSRTQINNESNLSITLIQGLSRNDRMEFSIQKSVELGVNKIIPVFCQRSNVRLSKEKQIKKLDHWRRVAVSACEQSGRCSIPEITEITSLNFITPLLSNNAHKFNLSPDARASLKDTDIENQEIELFVGPEGGLNDEETDFLQDNNFTNICFGPRILRTETAGPAVISALQMLWGDF